MAENNIAGTAADTVVYMTKAQVEQLIDEKLGSIRVYISESDITQAQENVKTIMAQAEF